MPASQDRKKPRGCISTKDSPGSDPQPQNSDLHEINGLLYLIYHRNKNQHRGQKWWKWVGMLRRSTKKLLVLDGKGWRRREEESEKASLEQWVRDVLVPRAWLAFTTLIADSQFSTLGVVLIAVLARVGRIVGLPEPEPKPLAIEADAQTLLASSVRQTGHDTGEIVLREYVEDKGKILERGTDREELNAYDKLKRGNASRYPGPEAGAEEPDRSEFGERGLKLTVVKESTAQQETETIKSQSRPKKRRKKGNAIDDLFGDLM